MRTRKDIRGVVFVERHALVLSDIPCSHEAAVLYGVGNVFAVACEIVVDEQGDVAHVDAAVVVQVADEGLCAGRSGQRQCCKEQQEVSDSGHNLIVLK